MKFQLNTLASAFAVAALAMGLTACGGSDDPVVVKAADIPAVTVTASDTAAVATAKAIATALVNQEVTLPALTATGTAGNIAAGTVLKFTSTTSTTAGTLSGFTLTPPTGEALTGNIVAGSCKFVIVTPVARAGQEFVFNPCAFDLNTTGASATGTAQSIPLTITLGSTPVSTTVSGVLTTNSSGGVTVSVGGTTVGTAAVATGSTGATGSN